MKLWVATKITCIYSESDDDGMDWYEDNDFQIMSVHRNYPGHLLRKCIVQEFDVEFSEQIVPSVYVLSLTYSDGDSFGNSTGNGELIYVFQDYKLAQQAHSTIDTQILHGDVSIIFVVDGNHTVTLSNPCYDYFCNLESIRITPKILL